MGKRELIALLNLSSWCLVMVERLFLVVPRGCLQFVIVVFPYHTHYFCDKKQFANVITGDETRVYYFEHVRKVSNKIWATKHSKRPNGL